MAGKAKKKLNKQLKKGKISQEQHTQLTNFLNTDNKLKSSGVAKAINKGNLDTAIHRADTATDLYNKTADNQDLRDSIQHSFNKKGGVNQGQQMYDQWAAMNPQQPSQGGSGDQGNTQDEPDTDLDTAMDDVQWSDGYPGGNDPRGPQSEIPNDINKDITDAAAASSADMVTKGNDFLDSGSNYDNKAQGAYEFGYNPKLADSFLADLDDAYNQRSSFIDEVYGIDPNDPGSEGEKFLSAKDSIIQDRLNTGLFDSDITSGYLSDLDQNYKQAKTAAKQGAYEATRAEKLGERTGLRGLTQNYGNALFGVGSNDKSVGSNLMTSGIQGLLSAGNLNLGNIRTLQDLIESDWGNENNARLTFWDLLTGDRENRKYNYPIADKYKEDYLRGPEETGFWDGVLGGFF